MEIVVVLYIVGIALIMGYLINRYPRERVAIIFLCAIVVLQVIQKCLHAYAAEFLATIEGAEKATTLYYSQTGVWFDEQGEPYKVVAWMPLPERYKG